MQAVAALRHGDPEQLGRYRLTGRLGEGAQGSVFLAQGPDGERVAVKLLKSQLEDGAGARTRFRRELEVARRVARYCTAAVLDADVHGDHPYIVSEYIPGRSLQEAVAEGGPLRDGALDRLAISTATALVSIHQAGIVHRDFKPGNVLLGPDSPRVIDFGLSRVLDEVAPTGSGVVGTPAYMAPEQLRNEKVTEAVDLFAWASTVVFASCGRPPFGADGFDPVTHRILFGEPDLGELRGDLRRVVEHCLNKEAAGRYTAAQVMHRLIGHGPVEATSPVPLDTMALAARLARGEPAAPTRADTPRSRRLWPGTRTVAGAALALAAGAGAVAVATKVVVDGKDPAPPGPVVQWYPEPFRGTWTGTGVQNDGKLIALSADLKEGEAHVAYPNEHCSGDWTLLGRTGEALTLRERITEGKRLCVETGLVALMRQPSGTLFFAYTGTTTSGRTYTVSGQLTRSG